MKEITVTLRFIDRDDLLPRNNFEKTREWLQRTLDDDLFTELGLKQPMVFITSMRQREITK